MTFRCMHNAGFSLIELLMSMSISSIILLAFMPMIAVGVRSYIDYAQVWSLYTDALTLHEQLIQLFHAPRCHGQAIRSYHHSVPYDSGLNELLELKLLDATIGAEHCTAVRVFVGEDNHLTSSRQRIWSLFMQSVNGSKPDVLMSYVSSVVYAWGFGTQTPLWEKTQRDLPFAEATRVRVIVEFTAGHHHLKQVYLINIYQGSAP